MINFIKKISRYHFIIRTIRFFRLRPIFRRLYYHLAKPSDGIFRFQVGGINAQFYVRTPGELRLLESTISKEKQSLERLLSIIHTGDVIYDIGASVGFYTVLLAKAVGERGRVIAFEPESQSFDRLQDNLRLNSLSNVRSFRKALGEHNKEGKLYAGEDSEWCRLINPPINRPDISSQIVEVVRGDDFQEAENLLLPRVIKIDVEGYEYAVLQGLHAILSSSTCELILVEIHPTLLPPSVKPELLTKLLTSLGFNSIVTYQRGGEYHIFAHKVKEV